MREEWRMAINLLSIDQCKMILLMIESNIKYGQSLNGFGLELRWLGVRLIDGVYHPTYLHIQGGHVRLNLVVQIIEGAQLKQAIEEHLKIINPT